MEVMMADLPHVEYIDPEKITSEDIHKAEEKSKKIAARTKAKGLGVSLSNQVGLQNAKGFMHQIQRGHK